MSNSELPKLLTPAEAVMMPLALTVVPLTAARVEAPEADRVPVMAWLPLLSTPKVEVPVTPRVPPTLALPVVDTLDRDVAPVTPRVPAIAAFVPTSNVVPH